MANRRRSLSRALTHLAFISFVSCMAPAVAHAPTASQELRARIARNIATMADGTIVMYFKQPFSFRELFEEIEECSGRESQHDDTYWIAQTNPIRTGHGPALAVHYKDTHRVVFALGIETNPYIIRHERLHHLYPELSDSSVRAMHPDSVFGKDAPCGPWIHPS